MECRVPDESSVHEAVERLFAAARTEDRKALWNALVPTEEELSKDLPPGEKQVTYVPSFDLQELLDFIELFDRLLKASNKKDTVRIMLMSYCHIMESEFIATVIWNHLRLLSGQAPSWRFVRTTTGKNEEVCRYPTQKFEEIAKLASGLQQPIGAVLKDLWDSSLRNAFSHGRYHLSGGSVRPSAGLSPISRRGGLDSGQARSFPFDEIHNRYYAARALMYTVVEEHGKSSKLFE
jgi:hypothetical protein